MWTQSAWFKVVSAPTPANQYRMQIDELTSGGSLVTNATLAIVPTSSLQRFSQSSTLSGGGTVERVRPSFRYDLTNGATYDFTIRIGWPQMETGSVATSPIVTTAGTASRVADVVSLTGASSLIGQTGGSLYVEFERPNYNPTVVQRLFSVTDGSATNRISVIINNISSNIELLVTNGGVSQASIVGSAITSSAKFAVGYAVNDIAFYVNGASAGTDTSATIPATSQVNVGVADTGASGTGNFQGWIRSVALFPTRLANATLASITS
jgi:hypothetical protein